MIKLPIDADCVYLELATCFVKNSFPTEVLNRL